MPNLRLATMTAEIEANVRRALLEDVGTGDITVAVQVSANAFSKSAEEKIVAAGGSVTVI